MRERGLILLNSFGHLEIVWNEDDDDRMRAVIEKKLTEGVRFFILDEDGRYQGSVRDLQSLQGRKINIDEPDIEAFFGITSVRLQRSPEIGETKTRPSKNAKEIASSKSFAVQPLQGG